MNAQRNSLTYALAVVMIATSAAPSVAFAAQEARASSYQLPPTDRTQPGGVRGSVLDADSGAPIEGVTVVLQPEVIGAFPAGPASGSAFTTSSRAINTGSDGTYQFDGLAPGVYRIYVSRLGYRPYSITVELRGTVSPVAIALVAEPIPLQPVRSRGHARGTYESASAFSSNLDVARLFAADMRRMQFLTTDARELTHADVVEALTLGEPDVLRALQRLPGVSTRSDYTAELWTRGAPWAQTRVYFDGVPIFNPLHALGVVSGIGSNAIGAVWFHPGARSAAIGEGAAGVVDLQSRRAAGGGELNANADVSFVSAALALDQRVLDGRAGWMLSGRQTYFDWLTGLARRASDRDDVSFPYGFSEVAGRVDAWLGERSSIDASFLWERDHLTSVRPDQTERLRAEWGNIAGRASFATRIGGINLRHTAALSWHDGIVLPDSWRAGDIPLSAGSRRESDTSVGYHGITGTIWPEPASLAGPSWSAGYGFEQQRVGYFGPQVLPVPRFALTQAAEDGIRVTWRGTLPMATLWGERMWSAGERLGVRTGLRAEISDAPQNAGAVRLSPRVTARFSPLPEVALSAGLSRVFQYTQAIAPGGLYLASLATTDVWLLAGPATPAIRADIATAGMETWLAPGRAVTLNGFLRYATGVASSDPRPGRIYDRPAWVVGENTARGVELSVRQMTGTVTGAASYSLSRSDMEAADMSYAASSDRRHVLSLTTMVRATPALRAGAGFTAASGVPFTRTIATEADCAEDPGCDPSRLPWLSTPNAARAPTFASLDLLLDWSGRLRGFDIGAYVQLRNALGRENATIYTADEPGCMPIGCGGDLSSEYERGVPRMPVLGVRVRR
ncbi:hypothetical protein BH23GEM9_BH23GEM9_12580 [soil metagenome]